MSRPAPLAPPEVDLSRLAYFPLYIAKLQKSKAWLLCKRMPTLTRPLINLWLYAWQQRPAGSIEDDDDVLAEACGLDFDPFQDLREHLLRGWVKCSDGRLYLPAMVPMVEDGWKLITGRRKKGKAGAAKRWGNDAPHDATGIAGGIARKDSREGGSEGVSEGKGRATRAANGHDSARKAMLDLMTGIRNKTQPSDPTTAKVVEAMGGFERLCAKTDTALIDLMRDFEARYAAAQH